MTLKQRVMITLAKKPKTDGETPISLRFPALVDPRP